MGMKQKLKKAGNGFIKVFKSKNVVPVTVTKDRNKLLDGKTALITGGSGGIGFGIAQAFIESGCRVVIAGTNEQKLKRACEKLGENSRGIVLNVLNVAEMESKIREAATLFEENGQLDILVNSAGVHGDQHFAEVTEDTFDTVIGVNLKGAYFMCQKMGSYMAERKIHGHILNLSSSSALKPAWTPYEMSKWGVCGMTKGVASALIKKGIVVNAIAPGPVATEMLGRQEGDTLYMPDIPAQRYALPREVGELAVTLCSDLGNLIVGDTLYMSGGSGVIK